MTTDRDRVVILFYKFTEIAEPFDLRQQQLELAGGLNLTGRMIIAKEGINATFEGDREAIDIYREKLKSDERFSNIVFKESAGEGGAFPKLSIKVREEIVTLGAGEFDVTRETAPAIEADELERWYRDEEDFVILDLRNDYEIESGQFEKTVNPGLSNFRDLPQKIKELEPLKNKKVVTVCTGGIRCEKATCLLKKEGFDNIYQLKDGIHTYMQKYPSQHFKGTLFVFDNRITTSVVETENREVIGRCLFCDQPTEHYANDDSIRPSKKIICCPRCLNEHQEKLRPIK